MFIALSHPMAESTTHDYALNRKAIGLVCFCAFLDLIGFGILIPIQPFFAQHLGASPAAIIWLGASFSVMQFVFAPMWGKLSDRIGRRPVMIVSLFTSAAGYLGFGLTDSLKLLFVARMISGIGSANIGTAQAILTDLSTAETRAKVMGWMGAALGLGLFLGPALGGILAQNSDRAPALVACVLCTLNALLAIAFLPETRHRTPRASAVPGESVRALLKRLLAHDEFRLLFYLFALSATSFALVEQVLGLFIQQIWLPVFSPQINPAMVDKTAAAFTAGVYLAVGTASIVVQGALIGPLVRRFGERRLLLTGVVLMASGFSLIPVTPSFPAALPLLTAIAVVALALGMSLLNPCLGSLISRAVPDDARGSAMGLGQSISAMGRIIGPAIAAPLYSIGALLPIIAAAAVLWVGSELARRLLQERNP